MAEQQKSASSWSSAQDSDLSEKKKRSTNQPLPAVPPRQYAPLSAPTVTWGDEDKDALSKDSHDYQSLDRGQPSGTQPEHLVREQSTCTAVPSISSPSTSTSQASTPATTSSQQNTRPMVPPPYVPRSQPRPLPQQPVSLKAQTTCPQPQSADNADEIMELRGKASGVPAAPEGQNQVQDGKEKVDFNNIPNTNFAIACMVALCFNLPIGILAMYLSLRAVKAFQGGQIKLGEKRSRWSIFISLLGIATTTVIISSIVFYIAMQGQKRISRQKSYGVVSGLNL